MPWGCWLLAFTATQAYSPQNPQTCHKLTTNSITNCYQRQLPRRRKRKHVIFALSIMSSRLALNIDCKDDFLINDIFWHHSSVSGSNKGWPPSTARTPDVMPCSLVGTDVSGIYADSPFSAAGPFEKLLLSICLLRITSQKKMILCHRHKNLKYYELTSTKFKVLGSVPRKYIPLDIFLKRCNIT